MLQKTCTVDGIRYRAVKNNQGCHNCAANYNLHKNEWNETLCGKLPDCFTPEEVGRQYISWIKVIPRKKNTATP